MTLPAQDIVERLHKAMDGVTPGPWFEGDKWVFAPPLDPENNASSALRNILRDVPEDELQANCAYIALCSPDNIGALLATISRLTADNEAERAAMDVTQRRAISAESRANALAQEAAEAKRLLANSLKEFAPISAASHRSEVQAFLVRVALANEEAGQ